MSGPRGVDWVTVQRAIRAWVAGGTQLPIGSVYWGGQDAPRVAEPAVEMCLFDYKPLTEPWLDRDSNPLVVPTKTVTAVDTSTGSLTIPTHRLVTGDGPLRFATTGTLPAGLPTGDAWVVVVDADHLKVTDDFRKTGGNFPGNPVTTLAITTVGTGVLSLAGYGATRRAGQEINYAARSNGRLTLELNCHTSPAVGLDAAISVLQGVPARRMLPSQQTILSAANVGVQEIERVRYVRGVRNSVMFEPRANLLVYLSVPSEVVEPGSVIRYATGTNLVTGRDFSAP